MNRYPSQASMLAVSLFAAYGIANVYAQTMSKGPYSIPGLLIATLFAWPFAGALLMKAMGTQALKAEELDEAREMEMERAKASEPVDFNAPHLHPGERLIDPMLREQFLREAESAPVEQTTVAYPTGPIQYLTH